MPTLWRTLLTTAAGAVPLLAVLPAAAQNDAYRPNDAYGGGGDAYRPPNDSYRPDTYAPPRRDDSYDRSGERYGGYDQRERDADYRDRDEGYGERYHPPREGEEHYNYGPDGLRDGYDGPPPEGTYSNGEIIEAGEHFFGSVTKGLASVVEHAFRSYGRPNGYILGEDGGGAFIAGLRYGQGTLYTKYFGDHRVYWQGPSVGYDFGGEGAKTMVLVYNLHDPEEIYHRFGGVEGSAYLVGGVSMEYQQYGDVILAPIRSGVGLRLGANVGYLKYTRSPTWNPF